MPSPPPTAGITGIMPIFPNGCGDLFVSAEFFNIRASLQNKEKRGQERKTGGYQRADKSTPKWSEAAGVITRP